MRDHRIAGKATVPAVELLELLGAGRGRARGARSKGRLSLGHARGELPQFLPADEIERCTFEVALQPRAAGIRATLRSRIALAGGMQRSRVHAEATFGTASPELAPPPALAGDFVVPAERIYRELITFGPRYCNLHGEVRLGQAGGTGTVRSPAPPRSPAPMAGCPYLLDAAMHLACVWGQRYACFVAYPTGFAARVLSRPVAAGQRRCIVAPRNVGPRQLLCDLWLTDEQGAVCDAIAGLAMSPLAAGAPPPAWMTFGVSRA